MNYLGIDIGSSYTKYCIMDCKMNIKYWYEETPIQQKKYFDRKISELSVQYGDLHIVTCGYGKKNVEFSESQVSELTALAKGVNFIHPGENCILDIGGQDTKLIFQENGRITKFFLNDKCAAGCGRFLQNTLEYLKYKFYDVSIKEVYRPEIMLSSTCAIFAQSEIVELLANDYPVDKIIMLVIWQILSQAKALINKVDCEEIILSGGLTKIQGIESLASLILEKKVVVDSRAPYYSAVGCVLRAKEKYEEKS